LTETTSPTIQRRIARPIAADLPDTMVLLSGPRQCGKTTLVKALVEAEPGLVRARDDTGRTPLHWAARGTGISMLALLIDKGGDVNAVDRGGNAPIHGLASAGNTEGVRLLLDKGAEVDLASAEGETALHLAAEAGRVETVRLLIARKADIERAIAGYRSLFNRERGFMPTSRKLRDTLGQDTLYGATLTYAVFGRKLLADEQVLTHHRTSERVKTPYGLRVISQADGSLLPGHSGVYCAHQSYDPPHRRRQMVACPDAVAHRRSGIHVRLAHVPASTKAAGGILRPCREYTTVCWVL
jgi:energy-coupling factor transporter ATP-binding protein EcfA2